MRQRWRKIVALLLILAFAPSSVLAAMPLVWCVGADGRDAVEHLFHGGKHVDHRAFGQRTTASEESIGHVVDHDICQDWQLLGKSKIDAQAKDGILSFDLRSVVLLPPIPLEATILEQSHHRERPPAPPDPLHAALRSVVLLI